MICQNISICYWHEKIFVLCLTIVILRQLFLIIIKYFSNTLYERFILISNSLSPGYSVHEVNVTMSVIWDSIFEIAILEKNLLLHLVSYCFFMWVVATVSHPTIYAPFTFNSVITTLKKSYDIFRNLCIVFRNESMRKKAISGCSN